MNELLDAANSVFDDVVAFRRDLHQHPELGLDNPRTQEKILDALEDLPLEIHTGEGLTSVVADLDGTEDGPTVLLRADTDALPMTENSDEPFCSLDSGKAHAGNGRAQRNSSLATGEQLRPSFNLAWCRLSASLRAR